MADKGIIVDSIDVSECEFLWKEKLPKRFCNNGNLDCDCNSNLNCYFKQLKRKEKECEKLKKQLNQSMYLSEGILRLYAKRQNIKYKQALDEIEEFCTVYSANHDAYETVYKYILEIINKAKEK